MHSSKATALSCVPSENLPEYLPLLVSSYQLDLCGVVRTAICRTGVRVFVHRSRFGVLVYVLIVKRLFRETENYL